jgi:hypothetical protein
MPSQPELRNAGGTPLFMIQSDHPNVRWLVELLRARGWLTRKDILEEAKLGGGDYHERWVRALVHAAAAEIVKGQRGFNHFSNCTVEEITRAADQSISQGKLMVHYGIALRRRAHQRIESSFPRR